MAPPKKKKKSNTKDDEEISTSIPQYSTPSVDTVARRSAKIKTKEGDDREEEEIGASSDVFGGDSRTASKDEAESVDSEGWISEDLMLEENKIKEKNVAKFKKEEQQQSQREEMSKETRYKRLMALLSKSKFYSDHLKEKLKEDTSKELREKMLKNRKREAKNRKINGTSKEGKRKLDDVDEGENENGEDIETKISGRTFRGQEIPDQQPLLLTGGVMRDYQIQGYQWMSSLWENGINGILADEMGLGKTIQTIALFAHLVEMGVGGPFLIVAPLSTLPNWVKEFQRFTPDLPVVLYHGSKQERTRLIRKLKNEVRLPNIKVGIKSIFVTSFEIAMNDRPAFQHVRWKYIVVDEGHRLKNMHCRLIKELRKYEAGNKLLLTGTPLQNDLSELWSLLNFLMSEIFDDLNVFESWFNVKDMDVVKSEEKRILDQEKENNILSTLHQILTPFLLRRVKSDVDLKIPPKKEVLVYCPMSERQKEMYEAALEKTLHTLIDKNTKNNDEHMNGLEPSISKEEPTDDDSSYSLRGKSSDSNKNNNNNNNNGYDWTRRDADVRMSLKSRMMDLRKTTNHPYLIEYPLTEDGNFYRSDQDMIEICGKLKVLDQILEELLKRKHKVLIFSQMTRMLDILGDYLTFKGHRYSRLDGSMKFEERQENIERFGNDSDLRIFLLSTRAGGLGINLTTADTCIIYDSDWNPQQDLQAQDRCHRIGQEKPVMIYRLVTANTIDEKMVERAAAKRKLEKMVIHEKKFKSQDESGLNATMTSITPEDLIKLLKSRDHAGIVDRQDGAVFTTAELDAILDRSDLYWKSNSNTNDKVIKKNVDTDRIFKIIDSDGMKPSLTSIKEG